jgi:hypothetical protein
VYGWADTASQLRINFFAGSSQMTRKWKISTVAVLCNFDCVKVMFCLPFQCSFPSQCFVKTCVCHTSKDTFWNYFTAKRIDVRNFLGLVMIVNTWGVEWGRNWLSSPYLTRSKKPKSKEDWVPCKLGNSHVALESNVQSNHFLRFMQIVQNVSYAEYLKRGAYYPRFMNTCVILCLRSYRQWHYGQLNVTITAPIVVFEEASGSGLDFSG